MIEVVPRTRLVAPVLSQLLVNLNEVRISLLHRLHFANTPLSEVLEELSKLSGTRYTASDESKRLTGDFDTNSIPQVIQVIEETLGVQIR